MPRCPPVKEVTLIPFHLRITVDQAVKMLRSDVLWINFEFPAPEEVPPPDVKNAFDVLKDAQH